MICNKKVISFSIFGNNDKYIVGLFKNIELIYILYPGWHIYVYFDLTIGQENIQKLNKLPNVNAIDMSNSVIPPTLWRFLVNDDRTVDLFISRDTDSRINLREVVAVYYWINSKKRLHIMRDHPHHNFKILAGMWGMKNDFKFNIKDSILNFIKNKDLTERLLDQDYLSACIYNRYRHSILSHSSFHKKEIFSKSFPTELHEYKFVGEIYDENDNRAEQYKELMNNV